MKDFSALATTPSQYPTAMVYRHPTAKFIWKMVFGGYDLPWFRADEEVVIMEPNPELMKR